MDHISYYSGNLTGNMCVEIGNFVLEGINMIFLIVVMIVVYDFDENQMRISHLKVTH